MLEEWRDLAHSHTSSSSNADCLDLFRLSRDARVWKFFSWRFYEQLQGWSGFMCLVLTKIVAYSYKVFDFYIMILNKFSKIWINLYFFITYNWPQKLIFSQNRLLSWRVFFSISSLPVKNFYSKISFASYFEGFSSVLNTEVQIVFYSHSLLVWLLCFQQSIQFSPHFPREKVLIEKWNEISREADAEMIELKIVI